MSAHIMQTQEKCAECRHVIPHTTTPHVFEDRIVCGECWKTLSQGQSLVDEWINEDHSASEALQAEAEKTAQAMRKPTKRQMAYALDLGIANPWLYTREELKILIERMK